MIASGNPSAPFHRLAVQMLDGTLERLVEKPLNQSFQRRFAIRQAHF
jgi:hypothetical protein